MSKNYKPYQPEQDFLLPPSLKEWLPEKHLAYFVSEVVEELDLSGIYAVYERDERGQPPYDPRMMTKVLVYGYCVGVYSARRIQQKLTEDVGFRVLAAGNAPDFRTIHLEALKGLFEQVLKMAREAGAVKLGQVALEGTKVKANASKHKAMSYERMGEAEKQLEVEVKALLEEAAGVDAEEDGKYGKGKGGDEWPRELARRESRLAKLREAKAGLEGEAREQAEQEKARVEVQLKEREQKEAEQGRKFGGRPPQAPDPEQAKPEPKAQRNFPDPDSRIMKDGATKEFVQAYNAQAVVDSEAQVIVAAVTPQAHDKQQLVPRLEQVTILTGSKPQQATADAGYFSEANVSDPKLEGIDLLVGPDRQKHGEELPVATGPSPPPSFSKTL